MAHAEMNLANLDVSQTVESELPTGTVTFLLTDIEGSTKLWEAGADTTAISVARHYELLEAAVALHGGVRPVEQGEGDSVVGAFSRASDAVAAALDVQRAFAQEPWPAGGEVRVRMALHTGEIRLRDAGNYFGPTIIRCARMRAIGHGGQTLISDATRDLVVDSLPEAAELRDLGLHRLKDLGRAERIWQLVHPDLGHEFPPLRSLGAMPTNLPAQVSSFVGRDAEIAAVREAVRENRLVTLTGTGGCGKTRLALHAAADELDLHRDGVWCVELAPVAHGSEISEAIAGVFGLREEFGRPLIDTLAEQLHDLDALLVVDNCEQVLDAAAVMIEALLRACPRLRVLATSREPMSVAGEVAWRVPSLDQSTSVALFVDRAQQARPGFTPDAEASKAIDQIVDRLDGIPLAIELAAARVRMMHPTRIAAALDDRFRLLTGGSRTAMPRQQTLEASVAWSYELLDDDEQALARRLSVLHGFTLDAAEAISSDDEADRFGVLDVLTRLVDKSLVHVDLEDPESRYRMLESVRQFLQARLVELGDADAVRARHFSHFLALAEQLAPRLALGDGPRCLARLEAEHDNLDIALEWGDGAARTEEMLRFAAALTLFWELRGHLAKGGRWFARVLRDEDPQPSVARARALWGAAHVALYGDDFETMQIRAPQALAMAEAVGDEWAAGRALNSLGFATVLFDPDAGRAQLARSIELGRVSGDSWAVADGWKMTTVAYYVAHDEPGAADALEQFRIVAEQLKSEFFLAWHRFVVGYFAMHRGDYAVARAEFSRSADSCRLVGDPSTGGFTETFDLGARAETGDRNGAAAGLDSFIARASAEGGGFALGEAIAFRADIALAIGDAATAFGCVEPLVEMIREQGVPLWTAQVLRVLAASRRIAGDLDAAQAALDEAAALVVSYNNDWLVALIEYEGALVAHERGEPVRAEDLLHSALDRQARHDLKPGITATLDALGALALDAESLSEAVRCFAAADALRTAIGLATRPYDQAARAPHLDRARDLLGEEIFEQQWAEAANLPLAEMIEYVSRARGERKRPSAGWESLTPTEVRVVGLAAAGLTNPQIAERMFIARGTVKVHLSHVFAKLGVATRAELAAQATKRGLAETRPPNAPTNRV
jgi:predicted ATPase/class 3 adenylate cyclase/DNA-binding CsgD family transcriptional regulator